MQNQPSIDELLDIVAEFLGESVVPNLQGKMAFLALVASNALEVVRREIAQRNVAEQRELARLRVLMDRSGDLAELTNALCDEISKGGMRIDKLDLREHLWCTTMDNLAIDQPTYASYLHAINLRCNQSLRVAPVVAAGDSSND